MIDYLKQRGLMNPYRIRALIKNAINFNKLDLTGLVVFTEAASKNYVVTPIISAMAGAKVYAITSDSGHGTKEEIAELTYQFAKFCGVNDKVNVVFEKTNEIISQANIVTNLGFVRPINKKIISMMNRQAVIPYMCEAWEFRDGDVDLNSCKSANIPILATNENYSGLEVFDFCGTLCMKMLFELEIEIHKTKIVILSRDDFGKIIEKYLKANGANVNLIENLKSNENRLLLKDIDALIVADYKNNDLFIGAKDAQISGKELVNLSRRISMIQFTGKVDINELNKYDIPYYPKKSVEKLKMGMTLADLGPKPVIDLHCAGLKVGEVMAKARLHGKSVADTKMLALKHSPAQDFPFVSAHKEH